MCGIVLLHDHSMPHERAKSRVADALGQLTSRGPDEQNITALPGPILGHARLSVVDLSDSHQPMVSSDGRFALIFNGEIYNYRELRASLSDFWSFKTNGDTEVLLAGLVVHGEQFVHRLEGMWSFAFWDAHEEQLLLSRDRMGKKPLYYFSYKSVFACASELPALRCLAKEAWAEDVDSTADYFRYGFCLPGFTLWRGVYEVLPAHNLIWRRDGFCEQYPYWSIKPPAEEPGPDRKDDLTLRERLQSAVEKRLIADVEVGAFLSGGIDSSLVASLAQSSLSRPLKTYTIGFRDKTFDESSYAGRIAEYLGTDHSCQFFDEWNELDLEILLKSHFGQPFADISLLPTAMVSQVASHDVKVVLTGDGADELFGGYQRYQAKRLLQWYFLLPKPLRNHASSAIRKLPEPMAHHSHSLLKKAQLFLDLSARYDPDLPYIAPTLFSNEELRQLSPQLLERGHKLQHIDVETNLDDLERMLFFDSQVYLTQDILPKVDRATMAYGLEARSPFLDHKVVELAFQKPAKEHFRVGSGKRWIRRAFGNELPNFVWKRRKQGFGVPIHSWFRGSLSHSLRELIKNDNGLIDPIFVEKLLNQHRSGERDNGHRLWAIYAYFLSR